MEGWNETYSNILSCLKVKEWKKYRETKLFKTHISQTSNNRASFQKANVYKADPGSYTYDIVEGKTCETRFSYNP